MGAGLDIGRRVRDRRLAGGLSQGELAEEAGVSRALIGALEHGRHMPAADTAVRLARALDTSVERLFESGADPAVVAATPVLGGPLADGDLVRAAWIEDILAARILAGATVLTTGGPSADGVVSEGRVRLFAGAAPQGAVIAGCDPVLGVAEGLLERGGAARIVGVPATTGQALDALEAGRCHAALVHGPARLLDPPAGVRRWHLARWRSGFATHPELSRPSIEALLDGDMPMIQRDPTAACQQAVERAVRRLGAPRPEPRRIAGGHLEAARSALERRGAAVAIEPVALAMGLDFAELELHDVELWVPARHGSLPGVQALADLLGTARFRDRAGALPAYDLTDTGAAL